MADLNLEISQGYYSYQGSVRSSADAESLEKRHSTGYILMLSTRIFVIFNLPITGSTVHPTG